MAIKSIVVFTDVGVKDIDDELLLKYLIENKNDMIINVVFMGSDGVSPEQAMWNWSKYKEHILSKYSPEEKVKLCKKITYHTINNFKKMKCSFDYALQISPMDGYDGGNIEIKEKYIFAGDYITPNGSRPSFNRQGSNKILDRFNNECKLVDIPSKHMAKMRFNQELLEKFTGPFFDSIVFTAFMLAFGRMNPEHPANKFAEGLINPEVGRGANYNSVMKMKDILQIDTSNDICYTKYCRSKKYFDIASIVYFKDLEDNGVKSETTEQSVKFLTEINKVLQGISDKSCEEHDTEIVDIFGKDGLQGVYVSNFDVNTIPELLKPSWELFKKNADKLFESFNPVYDLFAGYILVGKMCNEERVLHAPEQFLKNVCNEF